MILYPDKPRSKGVENGLKRAAQLVDAVYTPLKTLPISLPVINADLSRIYPDTHFPAYFPVQGIQYSSVRRVEKYVGINVSFETFFTAVANPNSVIYTRPIENTNQNVHNFYGIVCSCFVSYVLDLPYRMPCIRLPGIPGMHEVDSSDLKNLQLLDIILNVKKHVAIITGIERDVEGEVQAITVSESVMPTCRRTRMTPEAFTHYWLENDYRIYRYDHVDRITYTPTPFVPLPGDPPMPKPEINPYLMPDYGNKANYRLGEEPVVISVFDPAVKAVVVKGNDGLERMIPVKNGSVTVNPDHEGLYEVYPAIDGWRGPAVSFRATDFTFTLDRPSYRPGETLTATYRNAAGDPLVAWQFNRLPSDRGCGSAFTGDLPASGTLTLTVPDSEDPIELYLMSRNDYGFYTSARVPVPVVR